MACLKTWQEPRRLKPSMAWHLGELGDTGVRICLRTDTLGSTVSVLKDELRDHTRAVGLPRPQSHTSTSGTLTRASSSFRAAFSSMMKPRVMERPLLSWDAFCGLYYPVGQLRGATHPGMLQDLLPAVRPPLLPPLPRFC